MCGTAWNDLLDYGGCGNPGLQARNKFHAFSFLFQRIMAAQDELHIGRLIKEVFDASSMSITTFANRLNCERTNAYSIFKRRTMDLELLIRISEVLDHNFLDDIQTITGMNSTVFHPKFNVVVDLSHVKKEQWQKIIALMKEMEQVTTEL